MHVGYLATRMGTFRVYSGYIRIPEIRADAGCRGLPKDLVPNALKPHRIGAQAQSLHEEPRLWRLSPDPSIEQSLGSRNPWSGFRV